MARDAAFLRRHTDRPIKVTVPGPFTLSALAQDEHYGSIEALAILASLCGALALKAVLKILKFEIAFAFAAGALLAGRVVSLAVVQLMPDLGGHAIPGFPAYGLFSSFPSLVLSAWLVQLCAGRRRTVTN